MVKARAVPGTVVIAIFALFCVPAANAEEGTAQWRDADHIYQSICGYCHDEGVGPKIKGRSLPPAYLEYRARNGFLAMPAFRESEIDNADLRKLAESISVSKDTR